MNAPPLAAAHPLDAATRLVLQSDGRWLGHSHDAYWNMAGPFGGITAATLLRAALDHHDRQGDPLAVTVNFCAPIARGPFRIAARATRTNRSTQHWTIELEQEGTIAATATAVFAARRQTWSHRPVKPPELPPFDRIERFVFPMQIGWVERYDMRFVEGAPRFGDKVEMRSAVSKLKIRDEPPRPLDFLSLMALSDTFIVRIFIVRGTFVPAGTVSMTTYFHAGPEDFAAQGTEHLTAVADSKVFERGYFDQSAELWSASGTLLCTSGQIVYYKE